MDIKRCEKCGCKWDAEVGPHVCAPAPVVVEKKTVAKKEVVKEEE